MRLIKYVYFYYYFSFPKTEKKKIKKELNISAYLRQRSKLFLNHPPEICREEFL